jgi:hypothetical protein
MGTVVTTKYVRKPLYVSAVQVTEENFAEIRQWCMGEIQNKDGSDLPDGAEIDPKTQMIRIRVHNPQSQRQTKAFVGDWILYTDRGYKIYTDKAFKDNFDPVDTTKNLADTLEEEREATKLPV